MEPEFGLTTPVPPGYLTRAGYCATHPFRELVLSFLVSGRPGRSGSSDRFISPGCSSDPDRSAVSLARLSRSLPVMWSVYKHSFCYSPNFSFLSTQNAMDTHRRRRLRRGRRPHTPSVASALSSSAGPQRPRASVSVPPARLHRRPRPRHQCPPGAAPELFRVFCLRCAVHTATPLQHAVSTGRSPENVDTAGIRNPYAIQ